MLPVPPGTAAKRPLPGRGKSPDRRLFRARRPATFLVIAPLPTVWSDTAKEFVRTRSGTLIARYAIVTRLVCTIPDEMPAADPIGASETPAKGRTMEPVTRQAWLAVGLGALLSALDSARNLLVPVRPEPPAFPNPMVLLAVPVFLYLALLYLRRRTGLEGRAELREAGRMIAALAGFFFGAFFGTFTAFRHFQPTPLVIALGFTGALATVGGIGYLSVEVCGWVFAARDGGARRPDAEAGLTMPLKGKSTAAD